MYTDQQPEHSEISCQRKRMELQGVQRLVSQLCQAITLSYGGDMQCPFNHLIVYKGDFVWHIKCIHIWPDASEIA